MTTKPDPITYDITEGQLVRYQHDRPDETGYRHHMAAVTLPNPVQS
jgi:hypothetical protein